MVGTWSIGCSVKMEEQGLTSSQPIVNRTLPQWLLPHLHPSELKTSYRPYLIIVLPKNEGLAAQGDIRMTHPSTWEAHLVEIKYCDEAHPDAQLQNARVQHSRLKQLLRAQGSHIKMHTILLGVVGTIYQGHTDTLLRRLGLDHGNIKKVTHKLHNRSIQLATKIISTRQKLSFNSKK